MTHQMDDVRWFLMCNLSPKPLVMTTGSWPHDLYIAICSNCDHFILSLVHCENFKTVGRAQSLYLSEMYALCVCMLMQLRYLMCNFLLLISVQPGGNFHVDSAQTNEDKTLNFVLLDGTWNNSAAMFRRLKVIPQHTALFFLFVQCF